MTEPRPTYPHLLDTPNLAADPSEADSEVSLRAECLLPDGILVYRGD